MTPFETTPEGWIDLGTPSDQTRAWALARTRRDDVRGLEVNEPFASEDNRSIGPIAERGVQAWLTSQRIRFEANGGLDDLPDLVIAGRGVAVRCRGSNFPFERDSLLQVFADQTHEGDERLFVGRERRLDRYLILGGLPTLRVQARARFVPVGAYVIGIGHSRRAGYHFPVSELEPPAEWIGAMLRRAHEADLVRAGS